MATTVCVCVFVRMCVCFKHLYVYTTLFIQLFSFLLFIKVKMKFEDFISIYLSVFLECYRGLVIIINKNALPYIYLASLCASCPFFPYS